MRCTSSGLFLSDRQTMTVSREKKNSLSRLTQFDDSEDSERVDTECTEGVLAVRHILLASFEQERASWTQHARTPKVRAITSD